MSFKFNEVLMVATPRTKPEKIHKRFESIIEKASRAYRQSPQWILAERERQRKAQADQTKANWLIEMLPSVLPELDGLMKWFQEFVPLADNGAQIPHAYLLREFEKAGFVNGEYVGHPPEWFHTRERVGRWNVGQAMNCLERGLAPHPMCAEFARRYFERES